MLNKLIEITQAGGDLALEMKREPQTIKSKDGSNWNYATQVDGEVEDLILGRLREEFPDTPIVAEEQDEHTIPGGTFLTVDPLDGTIPFSNGFSNWGTIIGYIEDGQPRTGVMYLPEAKTLIHASQGHGCYINGKHIRLDYQRPLAQTVVAAELGPWVPSDAWTTMAALRTRCRWLGGSGFAAASLADLLQGRAGVYPNFNAKIWDFSVGALAVTEAGGVACQPNGNPLTWNEINMQAVFAANEQLAREVLDIIAQS